MINRIRPLLLSATVLAGAALPLGAQAQVQAQPSRVLAEEERMAERLGRIEDALRDLQGVVYAVDQPQGSRPRAPVTMPSMAAGSTPATGMQPGSSSPADLSVRITAIEESLAQLTGRVEELNYRLERQQRELEQIAPSNDLPFGPAAMPGLPSDAVDALDEMPEGQPMEMDRAEATGGPADLMSGDAPAPSATAISLPDDPDAAYNVGYEAVLSADYDRAEAALEAFVQKFPDADQTADAKFLLGEVYLATNANSDAAKIFLDHVGQYKDDPRSVEAYLKLGISFARLERQAEACKVFRAGRAKFPDMTDRMRNRYTREQAAAGCQ